MIAFCLFYFFLWKCNIYPTLNRNTLLLDAYFCSPFYSAFAFKMVDISNMLTFQQVQCVGTPVCTRNANNRDVECTLKQWLRFLHTEMVEGIRGNIGGGNSYNCNTFSLRKNWYNTDTTSRPGVNIILHTSLQVYKNVFASYTICYYIW